MGLFPKDRDLNEVFDRVEIEVRASDFRLRSEELSIRLDSFLQHHLHWRSRTSIQRLIRDGSVLLAPALPRPAVRQRASAPPKRSAELHSERKSGRLLRDGALVVVKIPEELQIRPLAQPPDDLVVLYEDEEVLAADKPPLLPVHPSGRYLNDTLIQRVHARFHIESNKTARLPIRLCHRLDRETSGVCLCGKGDLAHRDLMRQFERRKVEKEYLAIVHGSPDGERGDIELPIGPARRSSVHLKMAVVPVGRGGQPSKTQWRVLERYERVTLVACRPFTGRQHQIRVHMDAIGHPLVGDKLYGVDEEIFLRNARGELEERDRRALELERQALHNHRLVWSSPRTGDRIEVVSPLARDLREYLDTKAAPA